VTDDEVIAAANIAGYALIEREVVPDRPMWGWGGNDLAPGWWPTRHLAIDHMRELLSRD